MTKNNLTLSTAFYREILIGWLILGPIFIGLLWITAVRGGFYWLICLLFLGLTLLLAKASLKKIVRYNACLKDSVREFYQVIMEPLLGADGKQTGLMKYKYIRSGTDGIPKHVSIPYIPFLVNSEAQNYVIGLKSSKFPDEPIILSSSLYEFKLTVEEKAHLTSFN